MSETITIYDLELEKERFERIQEKIEELDESRNYGKKHVGKKAFQLLDYLLEKEMESVNSSIHEAERKIQDLKEVTRSE